VRNVRSGGRGSGGGWGGLSPVVRWLLIGGVVAVLGIAGCCAFGMWQMRALVKDAQEQAERMRAEEEAKRKERTVEVSAAQLLKDFQADAEGAERKYKGKYLVVTGVVERVGKNRNEQHFVVLHGGDEQAKVKVECFFFPADDTEEARIEQLGKGAAVTVRGEFDGRVSNVQMRECVLGK
jgi:hypothetical protein